MGVWFSNCQVIVLKVEHSFALWASVLLLKPGYIHQNQCRLKKNNKTPWMCVAANESLPSVISYSMEKMCVLINTLYNPPYDIFLIYFIFGCVIFIPLITLVFYPACCCKFEMLNNISKCSCPGVQPEILNIIVCNKYYNMITNTLCIYTYICMWWQVTRSNFIKGRLCFVKHIKSVLCTRSQYHVRPCKRHSIVHTGMNTKQTNCKVWQKQVTT